VALFIDMGIILKGWHYALLDIPWPFISKDTIRRKVTFTESCRYNLGDDDQLDWNKLFGLSLGGFHHDNSVRYGWRYNPSTDLIEVAAYYYIDGVRNSKKIFHFEIGEEYEMVITVTEHKYIFHVPGKGLITSVNKNKTAKWGYELGLFFGGNKPAPHKIEVTFK
jgi:hypothetical protein